MSTGDDYAPTRAEANREQAIEQQQAEAYEEGWHAAMRWHLSTSMKAALLEHGLGLHFGRVAIHDGGLPDWPDGLSEDEKSEWDAGFRDCLNLRREALEHQQEVDQ